MKIFLTIFVLFLSLKTNALEYLGVKPICIAKLIDYKNNEISTGFIYPLKELTKCKELEDDNFADEQWIQDYYFRDSKINRNIQMVRYHYRSYRHTEDAIIFIEFDDNPSEDSTVTIRSEIFSSNSGCDMSIPFGKPPKKIDDTKFSFSQNLTTQGFIDPLGRQNGTDVNLDLPDCIACCDGTFNQVFDIEERKVVEKSVILHSSETSSEWWNKSVGITKCYYNFFLNPNLNNIKFEFSWDEHQEKVQKFLKECK
jgi:hypothetical protein